MFGANRWNVKGVPMVYCADHPSTALLETIVHMSDDLLPRSYQLLAIEAPDLIQIAEPSLPADWETSERATRRIGTAFARENRAALMIIPSVIMPQARNYLLNPNHPEAKDIQIVETWRYPFDSRLLANS